MSERIKDKIEEIEKYLSELEKITQNNLENCARDILKDIGPRRIEPVNTLCK